MAEKIPVPSVVTEKTHVGKVRFPQSVPEGLIDLLQFPEDVFEYAPKLGLNERAVKLLIAALHGKWALTIVVDTQRWAIHTAMQYAEMDEIIRDLVKKNYAQVGERLNLYRFWICLLHVKGIRFVEE